MSSKYMKWLSIATVILTITIVGFLRFKIKNDERSALMEFYLLNIKERAEQTLRNSYTTCLTIAMTINDEGQPENFEEVACELLNNNPEVDLVQLVPGGVIKYVYPLEGNEATLNYDILGSTLTPIISYEAQRTKEDNKVYFSGPLPLIQGGMGIVGRIPVTKKNKFWGFSAVVLKLETFLEITGISSWNDERFKVQFSKIDPLTGEEVFFIENTPMPDLYKHVVVEIPNEGWRFYIIDDTPSEFIFEFFLEVILLIIILLFLIRGVYHFFTKSEHLEQTVSVQSQKIQENERLFEVIFNEAAIGILKIQIQDCKIILSNHHFNGMLGYGCNDLNQLNFKTLISIEHIHEMEVLMDRIISKELKYFNTELQFIHKNGSLFWFNLSISGITNQDNEIDHFLAIVENINSRKITEEKNIEILKRYESLFYHSPIPMWEEDFSQIKLYLDSLEISGLSKEEITVHISNNPHIVEKCISLLNVIDVNEACLTLHQAKSKEELLHAIPSIFPESAFDSFVNQLVCIILKEKQFSTQSTTLTLDGVQKHINFRWNVMRGYEDNYSRVTVTTEDITQSKRQQDLLISSQEKISELVNAIDGVVWECKGIDFTPVFVSEKVNDILCYTPHEWLSCQHFWQELIHPDEKESIIEEFQNRCIEGSNFSQEYRLKTKYNSFIWVRDYISVNYKNDTLHSVRGIMVDITKFKEIQSDLSRSHEILFKQNKRLLNFSHIVSHNLRSHSANILAISHLFEKSSSADEKEEYYSMIVEIAQQLNHTLSNLNQLTHNDENNEITAAEFNLKRSVDEAITVQKSTIQANGAQVYNLVPDFMVIKFNGAYLESIIYNLLSNALKFRDPNKVCVITFKAFKQENSIVMEISDNGLGIQLNEKNKDKVFHMHKVFHRNISTSGLGLFMVKNQMEAMGGSIDVESEIGVGTKFILTFTL
jgi:PAS domain S-box-containing protein